MKLKYIVLFDIQTQENIIENKVVSPDKEPTIMFQKEIHKNYLKARRKRKWLQLRYAIISLFN